eukprot:CAMPEP_0174265504 /NCGR_PEP_ID=MMETSP0439-20130205/26761_1 /TAXON_ID=0 /ORGANISM="Stereomyxa ramosa, Strain Chinc5" /LENGTH=201 /DNA_ID=CAMNT_0015351997 /DNA_START=575 /DNA_END=1177 /DNA_ORIENTATION=-
MALATQQRWTCCRATEQNAAGCRKGRHIPDDKTTEILKSFECPERLTPTTPKMKVLISWESEGENVEDFLVSTATIDGKEDYVYDLIQTGIVTHVVTVHDTLPGLALKYGVTVEAIKLANNLTLSSNSVFEYKTLKIPNPRRLPTKKELQDTKPACGKEDIAISRFRNLMGATEWEAKYYLGENDWDVKSAVEEYKADLEW